MGSVLDKNSAQVRKRIEGHTFEDETGEEYGKSEFNGFGDYFRRKKIKLQNLDADMRSASDKPQLFKGIVVHVIGYTQPSLQVLHREIVQHGGGFLQYLDSKTMATHIIASNLPPKKVVDFNRYRIVKPAWVVDSIAAGKLLPWSDYRVISEGPRQKVLKLDNDKPVSQESPQSRQGYHEQTDASFYTAQLQNAKTSQPWSQTVEKTNTPGRAPILGMVSSKEESPMVKSGTSVSPETPSKGPGTGDIPEEDLAGIPHAGFTSNDPSALGDHAESHSRMTEPPENATSEEHNAWLLSDPRLRTSSTANPDFLKQFYSESRLHHLSTWKAELKSKMQRMAADKGMAGKPIRRRPGSRRYIMHVDFDSFFCAVSLKKNPEYIDKPAVVAHGTGNGSEIASCNYPARTFGVKNGMWMKRAFELCKDLKVLPYDFPAYEEASRLFYESILQIGGTVQSVSIDEALVDVTAIILGSTGSQGIGIDEGSVWREQEKVDELSQTLRRRIKDKTGCHVSVGIGGNILQAKVALRRAKPAGQYQLKPEAVLDIIGELKVEDLPGVAYSIGGKLEEVGVKLVKDLRDLSRERLSSILGPKTGEKLRDYARGIDKTEVGEQPPRKSVSAEVNWGIRFISQSEAEEFVYNLCRELERRLLNEQVKGKLLTMKIMKRAADAPLDPPKHLGHGKCDHFSKSTTFGVATHGHEVIGREAVSILRSFKFSPGDLRGLGVQMTKLDPIKPNLSTVGGSQPKLMFNVPTAASPGGRRSKSDPIDDGQSPIKPSPAVKNVEDLDPIADDPITPRKQKIHPAMALAMAGEKDAKAKTPLNVSGTQFIVPSNADPAVIAELPTDIRSRLMAQKSSAVASSSATPATRSEGFIADTSLPPQVDAEVFNALPEDMKAEVLASYGRQPAQVVHRSPRRDQRIQAPRKQASPSKRGGGIKNMFGKAQRQRDAQAGLLQTNFRNSTRPGSEDLQEGFFMAEELDPEFLAELPENVRKEVIADHRRQRLAQRSGLDAPARRQQATETGGFPSGQRRIQFPALPPKISFDSSGVSSLQEVKDMLDAWHTETRSEGPHRGDVEVLEKYVRRVILEERDMDKAVRLIKWLDIIVQQDGTGGNGQQIWQSTVDGIKVVAQEAVEKRGLPRLDI